jgi:predicted DNA-binding protein (UPF0251 family)
VLLYLSKGFTQSEIANKLNVNQSTVSRDLEEIRKKARTSLDLYVKDKIPNEFQIYISGVNEIIKTETKKGKKLWGGITEYRYGSCGTTTI